MIRSLLTLTAAILVAVPGTMANPGPAEAQSSSVGPGSADNPWLEQRVVNIAHSGGENEAPANTLYAFKHAVDNGADIIELDVHSSADEELVVIHDATVDRTTEGTGRVEDLTRAEIQEYDAAHWYVEGRGATHGLPEEAYELRGARQGEVSVPGYAPEDFRVPTLDEVFDAFPDTPIIMEIKGTSDEDLDSFYRTGRLLADFLNEQGRTDVIVASFNDLVVEDFHTRAPQIGTAPGTTGIAEYVLFGIRPPAHTVALQIPVEYEGIPLATRPFVERAQRDGYAVHIWFSGSAPDNEETYRRMLETCADGLMPANPSVFEQVLTSGGIERPGHPGVDPCDDPLSPIGSSASVGTPGSEAAPAIGSEALGLTPHAPAG